MKRKRFVWFAILAPVICFAAGSGQDSDMMVLMTNLVFQIGIIIFAAKLGGLAFEKMKLPSVLGELLSGVLIGPYALGGLQLPGFPGGFFPLIIGGSFPVRPELYGLATIASILLLFLSGLETDIKLFLRYAGGGGLVALGGVVGSFLVGIIIGNVLMHYPIMDPRCLFLGIIGTATSVGITARILSDNKSMDKPEAVTILAGAVIDDVLGIIALAIVLGIAILLQQHQSASLDWGKIGGIAARAFGIWLGFTALGLLAAKRFSHFLKLFKDQISIAILAFGLALLLSGFFEKAGLTMIIGAYIMGLSLSNTDISYVIQEALQPIARLLVPVFFAVMGMLVNIKVFLVPATLVFGLVYTMGSILGKIVGCGAPALLMNFNRRGAYRIGLGMVPRGEVALIIAGIGLSYQILDETIFGAAIMMTLFTTVVTPPLFVASIKNTAGGVRKPGKTVEKISTIFSLPTVEFTDLMLSHILKIFENEGFFTCMFRTDANVYQIRREQNFITLVREQQRLVFKTDAGDVNFIRILVYSATIMLHGAIEQLKNQTTPKPLLESLEAAPNQERIVKSLSKIAAPEFILPELRGDDLQQTSAELIRQLNATGNVINPKILLKELHRQSHALISSATHTVAILHTRTANVSRMLLASGRKTSGFRCCDGTGNPAHLLILLLSPLSPNIPHLQVLAEIATRMKNQELISQLLGSKTPEEITAAFNR